MEYMYMFVQVSELGDKLLKADVSVDRLWTIQKISHHVPWGGDPWRLVSTPLPVLSQATHIGTDIHRPKSRYDSAVALWRGVWNDMWFCEWARGFHAQCV